MGKALQRSCRDRESQDERENLHALVECLVRHISLDAYEGVLEDWSRSSLGAALQDAIAEYCREQEE